MPRHTSARRKADLAARGTFGLRGALVRAALALALVFVGVVALHAAPALASGSVSAWGLDNYGQVSATPSGTDFTAVSAGRYHNVALKSDGSLVSWGRNDFGQVSGTPSGNDFVSVSAGTAHSLALRSDGSLVAWGLNIQGSVSATPTSKDFTVVSAGAAHNVALRRDGSLVSWGDDYWGQVSDTPSGNDFIAVSAGSGFSVALRSDGSLVSWGLGDDGQVSGTPSGNDFIAVSAGGYHGVALKSDGSLASWGYDYMGQVSATPSGNDFIAVSAGGYHTVALRSDGSLVAWGLDEDGQVSGVPSGNHFFAVSAGWSGNVALKSAPADQTPPVVNVPTGGLTVNATSPAGATVNFEATATDEVDGTLTPMCTPASGSVFAIGTTIVSCSATDLAGNTGSATFTVTVRGASAQIAYEITWVRQSSLPKGAKQSLIAKLSAAEAQLGAGHRKAAVNTLDAALHYVRAQSGKAIPAKTALTLVTDINRIKVVIGN